MLVYAVVIIATHLTSFMDAMVVHPWLMNAEQWLYVVTGYVFLLPLIGNEPLRWRLPHLGRVMLILLAMTPDTVVGIVLMQATHNPFPVMEGQHPMWAPGWLRDVGTAGGLMWAGGDGLMMLMGIGIVIAMLVDPGRDAMLGSGLENVRRRTLAGHVARADADAPGFADDVDVDDDDAVLEAYNRMLGRLGDQS
jgi:putative copper resistance protein D